MLTKNKNFTPEWICADILGILKEKFDVKKFMKKNPNLTSPDFYMVMYNETEGLVK